MSQGPTIFSSAVGVGAANRAADVTLAQRLLNAVPPPRGGASPALDVDGLCGPITCGAIRRFQFVNLGFADGRIDPGGKTQQALLALLQSMGLLPALLGPGAGSTGGNPTTTTTAPGGSQAPATSELRQKIVDWATMCTKGPHGDVVSAPGMGIVSDRDTVVEQLNGSSRTVRRGWKNLKAIFDDTVAGWTEQHWKAPGYLDGVKLPGRRVPQQGTDGVSWCGIFATWCWQKAGMPVKWRAGIGPTAGTKVTGNAGIRRGDICVQAAKSHHFVVVDDLGDTLMGVNGNSDWQSILLKPMARSSVLRYIRPD